MARAGARTRPGDVRDRAVQERARDDVPERVLLSRLSAIQEQLGQQVGVFLEVLGAHEIEGVEAIGTADEAERVEHMDAVPQPLAPPLGRAVEGLAFDIEHDRRVGHLQQPGVGATAALAGAGSCDGHQVPVASEGDDSARRP